MSTNNAQSTPSYQSDLAAFDRAHQQAHNDDLLERTPTDAATRVDTERDTAYYKLERVATPQRDNTPEHTEIAISSSPPPDSSDDKTENNTVDEKNTKTRRRSSLAEKIGYVLHHHHHREKNGDRDGDGESER